MDRSAAISLIKGRLARWNDTVLTTYIIEELKAAQQRAEMHATLPWFLLTESTYTTTTVDDERVELPSDFLREAEEDAFWLTNAEGSEVLLRKDDYFAIKTRWPDAGTPRRYALVGRYFRLRPVPDAAYSVRMIYYGKDTVLSTDVENKWLEHAPEILICETGHVIASRYVRNDIAANEFKMDLMRAWKDLEVANQARLDANRIYGSDN